jgi:TP901 family phage tail tape measure protein
MGLEMKKTGRQMTRWITLPMVAVGTTAATAAAKTESSMKRLKVAVGASREEMERVEQATKDVATTTGLAMDKVVKAQKLAQSSQLDTAEANELVASTAKLAASGYGNMERQVNFATTATLKFGDEISNATEALEIAGQTAQKVQIRIGEFIPQFQRALSPMNQLNISLREGAALFAGLADAAGNVNQAGTQFRRLLISLQQPSESLQKVIEKQFDSFEKFKQALGKNAFKALRKLKKGMDSADTSMKDLLGRINAVIGAGNLFTGNMQRAKDALVETGEAAGFIERVFKRSSTSIREMNKAWNKIRFAIEPLGAEVLPIVVREMNRTARAAQDLSKWFASLSQETKNSIVFWSEIATVAGPVVLIFGQLALGLSRIITLMQKTGNLIVWVSGLVKNLTSGLWALFNISVKIKALRLAVHIKRIASAITTAAVATWGWVAPIAAVVGVAALLAEAAVLISQNWGKLTTFFNKWTQGFQNMMFDVGQWVVGLFNWAVEGIAEEFRWVANKVKDFFKPVLDWLISMFITTLKKINEAATSLIRHLARAAAFVDEGLSLSLSSAADNLQKNVNKLRKVQEEGLAVGPSIQNALDKLKNKADFAAEFWEKRAKEIKNNIVDFTKSWAKEISSTARITFEEAWKTVKIANKKALKDLRNQFQQFGFFTGDAESMGVFSPKLSKRQNALVSGDVAGALFETNEEREKRMKMVEEWQRAQKAAKKQQKKLNDIIEDTGKNAKEAATKGEKSMQTIGKSAKDVGTILRNEAAGFGGIWADQFDRAEQRWIEFADTLIKSTVRIMKLMGAMGKTAKKNALDRSQGGTVGAIASLATTVVGLFSGGGGGGGISKSAQNALINQDTGAAVATMFNDTPGVVRAKRGNLASFKKGDFVAASQTRKGLKNQITGGSAQNTQITVNVMTGVDTAAEAAVRRQIPNIQEAVEKGLVKQLNSGGGKFTTAVNRAT